MLKDAVQLTKMNHDSFNRPISVSTTDRHQQMIL